MVGAEEGMTEHLPQEVATAREMTGGEMTGVVTEVVEDGTSMFTSLTLAFLKQLLGISVRESWM